MPDLLAILNHGSASLSAHRAAAATASHNLQNANTPGYARQRAELEAVIPAQDLGNGQLGRGVVLATISQSRDRFLERQMPAAFSAQARSSAEAEVLASIAALNPGAEEGLGSALGTFYTSLRTLSQNPGDTGLRLASVSAGRALGLSFARAAQSIDEARSGVDAKLGGIVSEVNNAAAAVARLNREIRQSRAGGAEPNDLLDTRNRHLDKLAELTGATPVPNAQGDLGVALGNGTALVSGDRAASLSLVPDPASNGRAAIAIRPPDGSGPTTLPGNLFAGATGGLLDARDGALAVAASGLDQLAFDLAGAVNTTHRAGFDLDGGSGQDFFAAPAQVAGAARQLGVDAALLADPRRLAAAASATAPSGDATNLHALVATERLALSNGLDAGQTLGRITTDFGAQAARARSISEQDGGILDHLVDLRESASGVSIDEELINLTKAQRAFEAVMKVITTADGMLDSLLKLR